MTEQELAKIERYSEFAEDAIKNGVPILYGTEQVSKLLAEVRRLRRELEEVREVAKGGMMPYYSGRWWSVPIVPPQEEE